MTQRFLDPQVLGSISGLELVAKTVVDGFINGLHRSPDFGFSQEFAEYQMYNRGDDLRHVDWNVYARTDRMYLKRYRGETNTQLTLLVDASASMGFSSGKTSKLEYARYLAASMAYLAHQQRDAAGIIVFDDEVRQFVPPSSRQGQFHRMLHAIETMTIGTRTDYARPFLRLLEFLRRRGVVVVISDFYAPPDEVLATVLPLRAQRSEMVMFHVLDPQELEPSLDEPMMLVDMETQEIMEVVPEYARKEYRQRIQAHAADLRAKAQGAGIDYMLLRTDRPLDEALREYLLVRQGRM